MTYHVSFELVADTEFKIASNFTFNAGKVSTLSKCLLVWYCTCSNIYETKRKNQKDPKIYFWVGM